MQKIQAASRTLRELLDGKKYTIDYYQREYRWEQKQIFELIDDLVNAFLEDYRPGHLRTAVESYSRYFLGSIIVSDKEDGRYIVDGQQRLTSLTLLLIYLRNLQQGRPDQVDIDDLVYSEKYGQKSFNLNVDERTPVLEALFERRDFDTSNRSESVQNIEVRYADIEARFPIKSVDAPEDTASDEDAEASLSLDDATLPYFIDWLVENVYLVEITAFSDDDAYTIFESMNDRGLSLTPTDMLKGYLLANITQEDRRALASDLWRSRVRELNTNGREDASDFFKAWLRSQYADSIRERKKGARPRAYDRIGTEFHRWLKDESLSIGLDEGDDFFRFIDHDMDFYAAQYLRIMRASERQVPGLDRIRYNAQLGFTLQNMLLLAPLKPGDPPTEVDAKLRLVSHYVDILLTWRQWNFKLISHSGMQYAMFVAMRDIREMSSVADLAEGLHRMLKRDEAEISFDTDKTLRMHQQNRRFIRSLLARLTDFVEVGAGNPSRYEEYLAEKTQNRYEIEHIWAEHPERHRNEFAYAGDFLEYRNRIGGLLLVPKKFNASYGDLPYEQKLPHYNAQNLLARSLNPQAYERNPGFNEFIRRTGLPFKPHERFCKRDLDERQHLYSEIAQKLWNTDDLLAEA
jgi:uncharacterized protein with ParB-like and HNH nuclease domain